MLHAEVSLCTALGLALATGIIGGWLLGSLFGGRLSFLRSQSQPCDSSALLDARPAKGVPAPFVVDHTSETANPMEGGNAPCVRNTFSIALDRHLPESTRRGDPLSLILVRIDNYPCSGDRRGPRTDDKLIEAVGKLFIASVRSTDWVARFDMTTFAFLLPGTEHGNALIVAERLRKIISNAELPVGASPIQLTLSIGTTDLVQGDSSASILRRAEEALASAIRAGGDCIQSQLGGRSKASSNGTCTVVCQS